MTVEIDGERQVLVAEDEAPPDRAVHSPSQHKALFALADEVGLTRQERLEVSEMLLGRDITTWKYLSGHEAYRLIDAMNGYAYINHLMSEKNPESTDNG
jgi:hypothetical protein